MTNPPHGRGITGGETTMNAYDWKKTAGDRMPSMEECEDHGWSEGYDELGRLVVVFDDDSKLVDTGPIGGTIIIL